jgi:predicted HicB family RNase H-like nuclease
MPEKLVMFNFRVPREMRRRWKAEAKRRGMVLGELVKRAVERELNGNHHEAPKKI